MKSVVVAALVASLVQPAVADDTVPYIVQKDDSCIGIAIRVLGDRAAVADIHRLNPQLGPTPHHLVPGSVLTLPAAKPTGPDARLTRAFGNVKIRTPSSPDWGAAERGADLFRAYRVGAASQSSAEVKFADDGLLGMREQTIVIIYGPEKRLAKTITATAELESGTLESRLGELDGKPVVVRTAAGEADLRAGTVVVAVTGEGNSVLSNHGGKPVELRGRTKGKSAVKVAAGMGTRVVPGKAPEPPRPLPPAPAWVSISGPRIASSAGTIALQWSASERAATYRVAVQRDGDLIAAAIVPAQTTSLELPLAPGAYQISVAASDADGLESIPSAPLEIQRVVPTFVPTNGRVPAADARTPHVVALGTTVIAPSGLTCSAGGAFEPHLVLDHAGPVQVRCKDATERTGEPLWVEVVALEPPHEAPRPPLVMIAPAQPPPPPAAQVYELGVYSGYHSVAVRRPIAIASAPDRMSALDDGATVGIRGGLVRPGYGIEAELGMSALDTRGTSAGYEILDAGLYGMLRYVEGTVTLRALAGVQLATILDAADRGATAVGFSWGGAVTVPLRLVDLRMDLRHEIARGSGGGIGQGLTATVGAGVTFR